MAKGFTLAELRDDIRWQADLEEAELRLTDGALNKRINESISRFRTLVSSYSSPVFMERYETSTPDRTMTNEAGRRQNWIEIELSTLPVQIEDILGIDISVNDVTYELQSVTFGDRNKYILAGNYPGVPDSWFLIGESTLCLTPPTNQNYPLTVWFLPEGQDLEEDEDRFDPILKKGVDWVVWDVIEDVAIRDNYPRLERAAASQKKSYQGTILTAIGKRGRDRPAYRKDTRRRRLNRRSFRFFSNREGA